MLVILIDMQDTFSVDIYGPVTMLAIFNSCVNTVIYGATNKNFRTGYIRLLRKLGCFRFIPGLQEDLTELTEQYNIHSTGLVPTSKA